MEHFKLFKKLPSAEKRSPIQSISVWKCKICKTAQASYTCPRCSLPYCSLLCYKSQSHGECSESFYKDCVMDHLQGRNVSKQTRKKMVNLLQKMQVEAETEPEMTQDSVQDNHVPSLDERMRGVDLDEDLDKIWDLLTDEEKRDFEDFAKGGNLSEIIEVWEPWWLREIDHPKIVELDSGDPLDLSHREDIPSVIESPDLRDLFLRHPPSPSVAFSIVNTLYAYILICRAFNGDHLLSPQDSAEGLLELCCGFRGDRLLHSPEEAILAVMSDVDKSGLKSLLESRERRAEGMDDLSRVLSEPMFIQAALSDAHTLLRKCWKMADSKKRFADGFKKVEYFLAYVDQYGDVLEKGVPAVRFLHAAYFGETMEQLRAATALRDRNKNTEARKQRSERLIEELPVNPPS